MSDPRRTTVILPLALKQATVHDAEWKGITLTDAIKQALNAWLTAETRKAMHEGAFEDPSQ